MEIFRGLVVALLVVWFCSGGPVLWSQQVPESGFASIHQWENQSHRGQSQRPGPFAEGLPPASNRGLSRATHTVFGFYPYWAPGFSELRFQDLTHIAVFSLEADGSGNIVNARGWPNPALVEMAHSSNVKIVLVCTLFQSSQLEQLLSSNAARAALIRNLMEQMLQGQADGINIDFEGVPVAQKENLVLFMQELSVALHKAMPQGHLSIDTPAVDWSNGWNYAALADACDALMIMGYDYFWSGSPKAGPVAPLKGSSVWGKYGVQWTVEDYLAKVGNDRRGKLLLGVPYYGLDWPCIDTTLNAKTLATAKARLFSEAKEFSLLYGRKWDIASLTPWFSYVTDQIHQTWYDDEISLGLKFDLVLEKGLQGIGIWALTYDRGRQELWDLIRDRFASGSPPGPIRQYLPLLTKPRE